MSDAKLCLYRKMGKVMNYVFQWQMHGNLIKGTVFMTCLWKTLLLVLSPNDSQISTHHLSPPGFHITLLSIPKHVSNLKTQMSFLSSKTMVCIIPTYQSQYERNYHSLNPKHSLLYPLSLGRLCFSSYQEKILGLSQRPGHQHSSSTHLLRE